MYKYLLFALCLPYTAFALENQCDLSNHSSEIIGNCNEDGLGQASPPDSIFLMAGKICSGPAFDSYGELITSHRFYAEELADQGAAKRCYPFQVHRESAYEYEKFNEDCHNPSPYAVKETVTATYSCARLMK